MDSKIISSATALIRRSGSRTFAVMISAFLGLALVSSVTYAQQDFSQNSTAKKRVQPGPLASRIGSAVNWRTDIEAAIKESTQSGKPVFWYVPTVRGTFMDRKDSIDRYMLAGPFSWPAIIELLNQHFIPLKATPKPADQQKYEIRPYVFIEPGFVILDQTGDLVAKIDRLTTLHTQWLYQLISGYVENVSAPKRSAELQRLWEQFAKREYDQMGFSTSSNSEEGVELLLLEGMARFRQGNHAAAKAKWEQAGQLDPESPLAWKAAAEAEGFGPFVRGFEVHCQLPAEALQSGKASAGSAAPRHLYREDDLWQRGIEFLLEMQAENGGWFDSDYDFGGADSLPNVHVAVSAIAALALMDALSHPQLEDSLKDRVTQSLEKASRFLLNDEYLNLFDRDELAWAYAYRIRFLSRLVKQEPQVRDPLVANVRALEAMQTPSGSWFHEYPNPMVTALALLAFSESAEVGAEAQSDTITRGTEALSRDRFGNGGFSYASGRRPNRAAEGGESELIQSAGRMPLCELGLFLHDGSNMERLVKAIDRSFALAEPLMNSLKYDNHTSNHAYGGFFIWYDIEARGEAILRLTDAAAKTRFQDAQRELILGLPEVDGCFVDSHELGRVYGTSMALISLAKTRR
jgi:hypothetical protein